MATDRARANVIFRTSLAGISIQQRTTASLLDVPSVAAVLDLGCGAEAQEARAAIGYAAKQLNVYYVRNPGAWGLWWPPDTILIAYNAYAESLAHEVGHALGLDPANAHYGDIHAEK